jgi:formylglycine-generating enzyme required for sulfatase activity
MPAAIAHPHVSKLSIILPAAAILLFGVGIAGQIGLVDANGVMPAVEEPIVISVPPHRFTYRLDGEYYKNGLAVDAPMVQRNVATPLVVMKYQVTEAEYGRCVASGACAAVDKADVHGGDRPVTGVSWDDASAYARWLSAATGEVWTLPTQEQMAFAAGSRFPDDALGVDPTSRNPALRWLADYDRESRRKAVRNPMPQVSGHFGENEYGLADFAGNVWEWTTSCERRVDLAEAGVVRSAVATCGVYVTVGQDRSPMNAFVRWPKTGGCSVGTPPSNLGLRLVREDRWYVNLYIRLKNRGILP